MSFNKRIYTQSGLVNKAKTSGFEQFERYVTSPDAAIYHDDFSHTFCNEFMIVDKDKRVMLYEILKNHTNE